MIVMITIYVYKVNELLNHLNSMKLKKEKNLLDPIVMDQILFKILGNISDKLKQLLLISNFYYIIVIY